MDSSIGLRRCVHRPNLFTNCVPQNKESRCLARTMFPLFDARLKRIGL
jgi:hypothetical protein